jgi:hypothetical protein
VHVYAFLFCGLCLLWCISTIMVLMALVSRRAQSSVAIEIELSTAHCSIRQFIERDLGFHQVTTFMTTPAIRIFYPKECWVLEVSHLARPSRLLSSA